MDCCSLCLEINKDLLDSIMANSKRWQELNVKQVIEKHFWPLNSIQSSSWICLSCWQELYNFHNFYIRIEEAHVNFGRLIKVEDGIHLLDCKEEPISQKQKINDNGIKDSFAYCNLEPEISVHQLPNDLVIKNQSPIDEPLDEVDLDDLPFEQSSKRLRLDCSTNKDPLEKCRKSKVNKLRYRKNTESKLSTETKLEEKTIEESEIKQEPVDLNCNNDSDSGSDFNYQRDQESTENKKRKAYYKHRTNRKENDKFIAEHFKQMFCDICQVPFEHFPAMQKHFTDVHNQRGYVVCCSRKFFYRTLLVDHIHCHLNPDHFKCAECGKVVSDRKTFESHMLRVHRANEVVKQHCCDICGKSFAEAYVLKIHKLTHLPKEERKFPCTDCGKPYGSPYLLNIHRQAVHLKKFAKICYVCGISINTSTEFKVHMNKHDGLPVPVIHCDICGLRLTSERGLMLHKESQHPVGGKQEHCCPICPKISPTLRALKKHINTMHEKGYDHKCSLCEKAFKRAEALKDHMATHTGTTLYTCPWCPKTFNSNGNMHAHRKKIHPKEWQESKLQKYSGILPPEI